MVREWGLYNARVGLMEDKGRDLYGARVGLMEDKGRDLYEARTERYLLA